MNILISKLLILKKKQKKTNQDVIKTVWRVLRTNVVLNLQHKVNDFNGFNSWYYSHKLLKTTHLECTHLLYLYMYKWSKNKIIPQLRTVGGVIKTIRVPQTYKKMSRFNRVKPKIQVICTPLIFIRSICKTNFSNPKNCRRSHLDKRGTLPTIMQ